MPAIITDRFKKKVLINLQADVDSAANKYYVAVGRPVDWNAEDEAPTPSNTIRTIRDAQQNFTSIKNVEAHSFVVPRELLHQVWLQASHFALFRLRTDCQNIANMRNTSQHIIECCFFPAHEEIVKISTPNGSGM